MSGSFADVGREFRVDTITDHTELRSPILKLPDRIDAEWFRNWLVISNRSLRLFHEKWGPFVESATGFPWPAKKPDLDAALTFLPIAAKYPFFLMVFVRALDEIAGKKHPQFKKLYTEYVLALRTAGLSIPKERSADNDARLQLAQLAAVGNSEIVTAIVILDWACKRSPDKVRSMIDVAKNVPDLFDYIETVMACSFSQFNDYAIKNTRSEAEPNSVELGLNLTDVGDGESINSLNPGDEEEHAEAKQSQLLNEGSTVPQIAADQSPAPPLPEEAWLLDIEKLREVAEAARSQVPNETAVAHLTVLVASLAKHTEAYHLSLPRPVATSSFVERARFIVHGLLAIFAELDILNDELDKKLKEATHSLDRLPALATPNSLQDAEVAVANAEDASNTAHGVLTRHVQAKSLPLKQYLSVAQLLIQEAEDVGLESLNELMTAVNALESAGSSESRETSDKRADNPSDIAFASSKIRSTDRFATMDDNSEMLEVGGDLIPSVDHPEDMVPSIIGQFEDDPFAIPAVDVLEELAANESDPLFADIERKADDLFEKHEFGLGYHFARACEKVFGDKALPYNSDELRLVALGAKMAGLSKYEPEGFKDSLDACAARAHVLAEGGTLRDEARRTALLAAVVPTALFNVSESGNAFAVIDAVRAIGSCPGFFRINEVLEENRKSGFALTVPNIRAAGDANAGRSYAEGRRQAAIEQIRALQSATFRFALGQKVKHALLAPEGPVGSLSAALSTAKASEAALKFVEQFASRDAIMEMLTKIALGVGHGQVIDGAARERLVAFISDISSSCSEFAEAMRQVEELRAASGRMGLVRRLIDGLLAGIEHFRTQNSPSSGSRLIDSANIFANELMSKLEEILKGGPIEDLDRRAASLALHAPLLWLPGMTWSHAWTPSPNDASRLIDAIMQLPVPLIIGGREQALEVAIDARCREDAFVPAKMLLSFGSRFGFNESHIEDVQGRIETAESTRKGQLRSKFEEVAGLIHKVRRMALGSLKGSAELEERLRGVAIDDKPYELASDFIPEEVEGTHIVDVNAAFQRLEELENEARRLLDDGKKSFANSIDKLTEAGRITTEEQQSFLSLLAADDLATLSDWVSMFASDDQRRPVLAGPIVNHALKRFRDICATSKGVDLVRMQRAAAEGVDEGPFLFSQIDEERREDIGHSIRAWLDFKRGTKGNIGITQLGPRLTGLLSQLAFETELVELNKAKTEERRQIFVVDAKMRLPLDASSLMLPDFGSSTNGGWRVVAAPSSVSNNEILSLAEGAEPRGTLILLFGSLGIDRRDQLKLDCIKRRRKVLVVDELLLMTVLSASQRRPLELFEIAQAFTTAKPYQDYGRSSQVPPEMFKGRAKEMSSIVEPIGSYIVYGGRRLGKTALLRHIVRRTPDHASFGFLDLVDLPSTALWEKAAAVLPGVFNGRPVGTVEQFEKGINEYLEADGRRRVLMMLDEADNFVREQASENIRHHHVLRLLSLMANTNHRFKFVLSGLHNVSRITKTENSPLAQISNDPVRIGPLVNSDAGDAEELVRVPLAALGYEFARREDVWRILSFTNYYPILIQVFCQGLLEIIEEQQLRTGKLAKGISTQMVDGAMKNQKIRDELYQSFEKTIKHIEQRYELLTYIVAERALIDTTEGVDGDGMTASEVTERAGQYWPEAFPHGSDPSEIEYLLDEMEGFGILRWIPPGRWGLRSRMLLELMVSDEEDLLARIFSFKGRKPEIYFDPKNGRSKITGTGKPELDIKVSPLTDGQEAELLSPQREYGHATVVFGSSIANIEHTYVAIERSRAAKGVSTTEVHVEVRGWKDRADLMQEIRRAKQDDTTKVLVISNITDWKPEWVAEAARHPNVARGRIRPIFIGGPKQAQAWAIEYPMGSKYPARVHVEMLRPWARSYLATRLDMLNSLKSATIDKILDATGGWNDPCQTIFSPATTGAQIEKVLLEVATSLDSESVFTRFGVPAEFAATFRTIAEYCEDGTPIADAIEVMEGDIDPNVAIRFGTLVGVLSTVSDPQNSHGLLVSVNSVARKMLSTLGNK
ncbi:hypothetical protein CU100_25945 [Phyllobacterium endophyticum]|uniref:ORC1/DEAH AAA+ ATPase domain-containing protein n=2 Tax=Phyllobacterium endophyticum TaxID=1149773 RepID=A0A2P7AK70_9HYPH|nr:hypothetical protein CU100_25945 [Phyllobacterium endophyticum]